MTLAQTVSFHCCILSDCRKNSKLVCLHSIIKIGSSLCGIEQNTFFGLNTGLGVLVIYLFAPVICMQRVRQILKQLKLCH